MEYEMEIDPNVSAKLCDGGHVCSFPTECCSLGCCSYSNYPQIGSSIAEMLKFLFWYYWYLWIAVIAGLIIAAACGCYLCRRRSAHLIEDETMSDQASLGSCYLPPHYSRCSSLVQAMPPPYNEVTAKPDLYPLVIGYDEAYGKSNPGLVMRYFRTLSHASTLDSLSSSFMCNVVNEANTIIPPPYSCNNSIDELSSIGEGSGLCGAERPIDFGEGSMASLANHRTTSDVSSLAAQSPISPPRATSPTIELRELLEKIHQLPQLPSCNQSTSRPTALFASLSRRQKQQQHQHQHQHQQTSPSPTTDLNESTFSSSTSPSQRHNHNRHNHHYHHQQQPQTSSGYSRTKRTRGKTYYSVGAGPSSTSRSWLSRSAPTTPSGVIPSGVSAFLHQHHLYQEAANRHQAVPLLLAEQEENEQVSGAEGT